jgi:hypothetical protein
MSEADELKHLTDTELFDKMISHHIKSQDEERTKKSKWHHEKLYKFTKKLLWERLGKDGTRKSY